MGETARMRSFPQSVLRAPSRPSPFAVEVRGSSYGLTSDPSTCTWMLLFRYTVCVALMKSLSSAL